MVTVKSSRSTVRCKCFHSSNLIRSLEIRQISCTSQPAGRSKMIKRLFWLPVLLCGAAMAQDPPSLAGRLSYISGNVSFQPGGVSDWVQATRNRPLTIGDQLFADQGARAEVEIPQAEFRLGSRTAFQFLNLDDRNVQVRLSEGALAVHVRAMDQNVEVDTPNAAFTVSAAGDYRIDVNPDNNQSYVTVRYGEGQVTANGGSFAIHERQQAVIAGQDQPAQYQVYAAPGYDEFDNWAMSRDRRLEQRASSRYVSPYAVGYEDLDDYGSWRTYPQYGEVWVPRSVQAGWAPYQYGQWQWVEPWGWTWVDDQPWGYAPFHYGRWAYIDNSWGWVPCPVQARPYFAPALVAWFGFGGGSGLFASFGFGAGSIGWFPLGPRDVYIPAYHASPTYVSQVNTTNTTYVNNTNVTNIYNNYTRTGTVPITSYANRTVPGAIAAVPQTALVNARPVQQVITRVQPAQLNAVHAVTPAPKVAPQVASVLGRQTSLFSRVPQPAQAVVSRPVVAKSTPPPAPPPFQNRQTLLAEDPGRPIPVQQLHQLAATRPPAHVVAQARPVTPQVVNHPAPPISQAPVVAQRPAAPAPQPQPGVHVAPPPAVAQHPQPAPQARPYEPPSAQHPAQPNVRAQAPQAPAPQPAARAQAPRPFEPLSAERQAQPPVRAQAPPPQVQPAPAPQPAARAQAPHPAPAQHPAQPPVRAQAAPPAQQHQQPAVRAQAPPPRPAPAPQAHPYQPPRMQGEASRAAQPPARAQAPPPKPAPQQHAAPPPQAHPQPAPHKEGEKPDQRER